VYNVEIVNKGGYEFASRSNGCEFNIGLKGDSVTPPAVLLASLGSCIGVYIRKYFEGADGSLKEFSIELKAEFTKEKPVCFSLINVFVDLKGIELDQRRKQAFLAFIRNCPVHNTLMLAVKFDFEIITIKAGE